MYSIVALGLTTPQNRGAATIRRAPFGTAIFIHDSNMTDDAAPLVKAIL